MVRQLAVALFVAMAALFAAGQTVAAPTAYILQGSVSPGHIRLKGGLGQPYLHGRQGLYRISVTDSSHSDDFRLVGPGVNVVITGVPFVGARSVQVMLRPGTYRYRSDPHRARMNAKFVVG